MPHLIATIFYIAFKPDFSAIHPRRVDKYTIHLYSIKMILTKRQRQVLTFIKGHIAEKGYPPTVREICSHFGFASPLSAQQHIDALERKGYIKKHIARQRGLELVGVRFRPGLSIPVVGQIRAGEPILAAQYVDEYITVDQGFSLSEEGFALRVLGESMVEAGIFEGDIVLIDPRREPTNGDIVIALLDDEATIKRFYKDNITIRLVPENKTMKPIVVEPEKVQILGKVIGVLRKY